MNITIAFATLFILIVGVLAQLRVWKTRALMSPGFYFGLIWSIGVTGLLIFKSLDLAVEKYPKYIDELNILIAFTSLCFTFFVKKGRKTIGDESVVSINFLSSFGVFKVISLFYLFIAIFIFFTEGSGFDFGRARDSMHETIEKRSFWVGYFRTLSLPLAIYAGSRIIMLMKNNIKTSAITYLFLFLPFFADTLFSFTEGGRIAMVYSMLMYVIGGVMNLPIYFDFKNHKKIIINALIIIILINITISWVASVRADAKKNTHLVVLVKEKLGPFSFLHGAIDYIQTSYIGYQYRRTDAVDVNNFGYGVYTFNGFINWNIPFSGRLGLKDASIAKALDIYYHNQETYDFEREYYYMTHSSYIPIVKDFGFKGAFIALFIMVWITHTLFVKIQRKRNIRLSVSLFFFYLFFIYWAKSNFYGTLSSSILSTLYSFIIIDFVNFIVKTAPKKASIN